MKANLPLYAALTISSTATSCLRVCDIDQLRELVRQAKAAPLLVSILIDTCNSLPRKWKQKPPKAPKEESASAASEGTPTSRPSSRPSRPRSPKKQARERDGRRCALTRG